MYFVRSFLTSLLLRALILTAESALLMRPSFLLFRISTTGVNAGYVAVLLILVLYAPLLKRLISRSIKSPAGITGRLKRSGLSLTVRLELTDTFKLSLNRPFFVVITITPFPAL